MGNVTINIKNCGCGGGKSSPTSPTTPPFNDDLGDPNNPSGPPDGWQLSTSGLDDRQCKTAVWLYDWLEIILDFLGTTAVGAVIVALLKHSSIFSAFPLLQQALLTAVPTILALLAGPDPSDAAVAWIAWGISGAIVTSLAGLQTELITRPLIVDALAKIQPHKDEIICQLSRATNAEQASQVLTDTLDNIDGLTPEQEGVVLSFMPPQFFNLLFFTSDQWESFDDDYLSNITTVCCGDYTDGDPVVAGSVQQCSASWYIIDKLAETALAVYETRGTWMNYNWFNNDRPSVYNWLENNLATPRKIKERAFDYGAFINSVTDYTFNAFVTFGLYRYTWMDYWNDLNQYLTTNADTLTAALRAATNPQEAYDALQPVRDWITANLANDQDAQTYMLQALDDLIRIRDDQKGILDLLFFQDADLANYALDKDCSPGASGPAQFVMVYGLLAGQDGDVFTFNPEFLAGVGYFVTLNFGDDGAGNPTGPRGIVTEFLGNDGQINVAAGAWRGDADEYLGGAGAGWDTYDESQIPNRPFAPLRCLTVFSANAFSNLQLRIEVE